MSERIPRRDRDRGAVLPLVLAVSIFFALVILALAKLVTTDLSFARVAEARAEQKASALGAIEYGIERVRLGQTLCAGPSAQFGPVTAGLLDQNDATVSLTCSRLATDGSEITGWAAVITGNGISSGLLQVQGGGSKRVTGAMYINDVSDIVFTGSGPQLVHAGGDLWHRRNTCPGGAVNLPSNYSFEPATARGTVCTTATWNQVVATPTVPDLNSLPLNNGQTYTTIGSCRVFSPGHYTGPPSLSLSSARPDVYFQSGSYWFENTGSMEPANGQVVWFGHPGSNTAELANPDCAVASQLDPNAGGTGAVVYLSGDSRFRANGQLEFFDRLVNGTRMSVHALDNGSGYPPSTRTASSNSPVIRVRQGNAREIVFHGLVYAPNGWVEFLNATNTAKQQLLGGAVVARLSIQASASASGLEVSASPTPALVKLQLTATATSDDGSDATTATAIVDYRPDAIDPAGRVAVNSIRIVD